MYKPKEGNYSFNRTLDAQQDIWDKANRLLRKRKSRNEIIEGQLVKVYYLKNHL